MKKKTLSTILQLAYIVNSTDESEISVHNGPRIKDGYSQAITPRGQGQKLRPCVRGRVRGPTLSAVRPLRTGPNHTEATRYRDHDERVRMKEDLFSCTMQV